MRTGIILAGGKSARMGHEKGLLEFEGKTFIEWVIASLTPLTDKIIISSNTEAFHHLGLPVYADMYPDTGPLGGIYTGLFHSQTDENLVIACDMPLVTSQALQALLTHADGQNIVVPSLKGDLQPLCGFYRKSIQPGLQELLMKGQLKMMDVARHFNAYELAAQEWQDGIHPFVNINTPAEFQELKDNYEHSSIAFRRSHRSDGRNPDSVGGKPV